MGADWDNGTLRHVARIQHRSLDGVINAAALAAAAVTFLLLVVGCGSGRHKWSRPDFTTERWNRDNYTCMVQAGFYLPNPYSPLVVGNNDPSWGLGGLLYQVGQQRQYNDCMKALGWTPEDEPTTQMASQQPVQEEAKQVLARLRESEPTGPVCGLGSSYIQQAPEVIVAVSPRAQAQGLRPGDEIVAVDGERILVPGDSKAALDKRNPGDVIVLTLRSSGAERELHVECTDRRLALQALIATVEATAQGRWGDCATRSSEFEQLSGPSALAAYLRVVCRASEQAASRRPTDAEDATLLYELMRRRISEAAFASGGVESVRADVLKTVAQLDQWGFPTFARDLQSRLEPPTAGR